MNQHWNIDLNQKVFFTKIKYDGHIFGRSKKLPLKILKKVPFVLVTGIADNTLLVRELKMRGMVFKIINFCLNDATGTVVLNVILSKAALQGYTNFST